MREIIYRCWDKKSKKYRNIDNIVFNGNSTIHGDNLPNVVNCWGEDIIEQKDVLIHREKGEYELEAYTGLKDDKGNRIFEGDILKLKDNVDFGIGDPWYAVVEFGNPNGYYSWGFQLKPLGEVGGHLDILLWVETELENIECEIVGNIHEPKNQPK